MNDEKILNEEIIPDEEITETEQIQPETEEEQIESEITVEKQDTDENCVEADEEITAEKPDKVTPYHERYYLRYGDNEKQLVDLQGTMKFLQELGFDGGEMKQARKGHEEFNVINKSEKNESERMYCAYCGLEISGIEYFRLPDGRLRCTACSSSLVKSEMQELCDRVVANMEAFFGAVINVPIHIEVLEERKLKKKIKCPLSTIDDNSLLVLGAAVNDKKGYRIYLENGAPRISVVATFAHELTHIWQYINWDNNKEKKFPSCSKERRLLIYEGMAKWAEIQYLYLVGETAVARREEYVTRNRQDEYGIGFRLYEKQYPLSYETIICNSSPFIKDNYPID